VGGGESASKCQTIFEEGKKKKKEGKSAATGPTKGEADFIDSALRQARTGKRKKESEQLVREKSVSGTTKQPANSMRPREL